MTQFAIGAVQAHSSVSFLPYTNYMLPTGGAATCIQFGEVYALPLHLWDLGPARSNHLVGLDHSALGFSQLSFLRLLFKRKKKGKKIKNAVAALEKARSQQVTLLHKAGS